MKLCPVCKGLCEHPDETPEHEIIVVRCETCFGTGVDQNSVDPLDDPADRPDPQVTEGKG